MPRSIAEIDSVLRNLSNMIKKDKGIIRKTAFKKADQLLDERLAVKKENGI